MWWVLPGRVTGTARPRVGAEQGAPEGRSGVGRVSADRARCRSGSGRRDVEPRDEGGAQTRPLDCHGCPDRGQRVPGCWEPTHSARGRSHGWGLDDGDGRGGRGGVPQLRAGHPEQHVPLVRGAFPAARADQRDQVQKRRRRVLVSARRSRRRARAGAVTVSVHRCEGNLRSTVPGPRTARSCPTCRFHGPGPRRRSVRPPRCSRRRSTRPSHSGSGVHSSGAACGRSSPGSGWSTRRSRPWSCCWC